VLENSWHTLLKLVTTFSKLGLKAEKEKIVKTMQTNQISQTRISLLHPIHQDLPHRSILSYDDEELLRIRCSEDRSHLKMSQPKAGMRREQGKNQVDGLLRKTGSNALEFLRLIFASETENENIHQFNLVQRGRAKIRHERDQIWTMGTSRVDKLKNVIKHGALTQPTNEKKKKKKIEKKTTYSDWKIWMQCKLALHKNQKSSVERVAGELLRDQRQQPNQRAQNRQLQLGARALSQQFACRTRRHVQLRKSAREQNNNNNNRTNLRQIHCKIDGNNRQFFPRL
jgi:hypothetical protein